MISCLQCLQIFFSHLWIPYIASELGNIIPPICKSSKASWIVILFFILVFPRSWQFFSFSCFSCCLCLLVNSKYHEHNTKNSEWLTVITTPHLNHSLSSRNLLVKLTIDSKLTITWSSDSTQNFISLLAKDELVWLVCIHQFTTPRNNMIRVHTQSTCMSTYYHTLEKFLNVNQNQCHYTLWGL